MTDVVEGRGCHWLLDAASDAMLIVDDTGRILTANPTADLLFGAAPGTLGGRFISELMPERFRAHHDKMFSGYMREPQRRAMGAGMDLWGLRVDGTEFPVDISLSPLAIEGGAPKQTFARARNDSASCWIPLGSASWKSLHRRIFGNPAPRGRPGRRRCVCVHRRDRIPRRDTTVVVAGHSR